LRLAATPPRGLNQRVRPLIHELATTPTPESLVAQLGPARGVMLLRSAGFDSAQARYSFVAANPFLTFRSSGARCEITHHAPRTTDCVQFGNPWHLLDALMSRYELLDEIDLPFPLGGCFGYWGYDLKNFTEPKLPRRAVNDLELPDCHVGFYDSLVVFDHRLGTTCVVSTGLSADGSRTEARAREQVGFWTDKLGEKPAKNLPLNREETFNTQHSTANVQGQTFGHSLDVGSSMLNVECSQGCMGRADVSSTPSRAHFLAQPESERRAPARPVPGYLPHRAEPVLGAPISSNLPRAIFLAAVERVQRYIRAGDIYQVNLSQRLAAAWPASGWELFTRLLAVSPAPFAAYLDCGDFQLASSSPEQFLRMSGSHIATRPIKGTRPRSADATRDAQLAYELQTSPKELAELVMITDLLRNDLGRVCEFGSVQVPELAHLERFAQVQHLVSTVEGRLRNDVTHFAALASAFPGGSITGAPKFRAMEIIDELEPLARGPYCGSLGYLGFNRESQLNISIRTAIHKDATAYFHVGAGIVADSIPEAEYEETLAKAAGFLRALNLAQVGVQVESR
jgi:para-aminobenzoate synthetase component I